MNHVIRFRMDWRLRPLRRSIGLWTFWLLTGVAVALLYVSRSPVDAGSAAAPTPAVEPLSNLTAPSTPASDALLTLDGAWQPELYITYSIVWGDVDGDGDLDLAVGNFSQPSQLYYNDGGQLTLAPDWDFEPRKARSVAWGDVDGDGDLDLAVGNEGQPNQLYINENGVLTLDSEWTPMAFTTYSVAWGDVDGDGDLDLAVGNNGQPNQLYINENGVLTLDSEWTPIASTTYNVAWGDVDSDGDLDLAVGNNGQPNQLYRNDGRTLTRDPDPEMWNPSAASTYSVAWGDVDGDGDLDLAVGNFSQPNQLYRSDGGRLTLDSEWIPSSAQTRSVAWGDVDGDGDLDLAVGNFQQSNQLYRNDGGRLTLDTTWTTEPNITNCVAWGDVDGDGDLDLTEGNGRLEHPRPNRLYRNNGSPLILDPEWVPAARNTKSVAWGDVDGDGDLDLAVGNFSQPNQLYRNDGGELTLDSGWTPAARNTYSVAWGDVDGDGDLDLAVGNWSQSNQLYLNSGISLSLTPDTNWTPAIRETTSVAWGDVDGDGDLDLAVGNRSGQSKQLYINENGVLTLAPQWDFEPRWTYMVAWGDVDGDGDLDLVAGNRDALNQLYINENGILTLAQELHSEPRRTFSVAWGDVDGDGDLDLAAGNRWHPNQLYRNDGGTLTLDTVWMPPAGLTDSVAWGDVDGDGDLDLAAGSAFLNYSEPDQLYRNAGGTLTLNSVWLFDESYEHNTASIAWGDVDGDGDLDLVAGNSCLTNDCFTCYPNQLYRNNGKRGFSTLPNNPPSLALQQPYTLPAANFYAMSGHLTTQHIPISYTLFDTDGESVAQVDAVYSPDGGGRWLPAVATSDTVTTHLSTGYWLNRAVLTPTQAIPNTGIPLSANLVVSDSTGSAEAATVEVWLWITHTNNADLSVALRSPGGTQVSLFTAGQAGGQNFAHTRFSDAFLTPITSGTAPYTGTYRPLGDLDNFKGQTISGTWTLVITDSNALAGIGVLAAWGLRIQTPPAVHTFVWDTFASGFFGQSDNVVFRLMAHPQPATGAIKGTYQYPNSAPGPFQRPYAVASTLPFRVRGTQVRVFSESATLSNTATGALVYRLPAGQTSGATPFADSASKPFHTDSLGYLQGRGQLALGDQLVALFPVMATDTYTLYHTNARPTLAGLAAHTVVTPGVQVLTVTAANPLILFNLDLSLEWDAREDTLFLDQLEFDLRRASEILFDVTNGQAALGNLTIYHARQNWDTADVRIYANNTYIPNADVGGIVPDTVHEVITANPYSSASTPYTLTYRSGFARVGRAWQSGSSSQQDWAYSLVHELGHYLFYLNDTYLGRDAQGLIMPVSTCTATLMTDPMRYTEFLSDPTWSQVCTSTLTAQHTGRSEWATVQHFYPALQFNAANPGPAVLPLALTQIAQVLPATGPLPLATPLFYLVNEQGAAWQPTNAARAILYQEDGLLDLGRPYLDKVSAPGARSGDELCVYDLEADPPRMGCETLTPGDDTLLLAAVRADWQPEVLVTPVSSTTVQLTVGRVPTDVTGLVGQLYPNSGAASPPVTFTWESVTGVFSATVVLSEPTTASYVRVWAPGTTAPRLEVVTEYSLKGSPFRICIFGICFEIGRPTPMAAAKPAETTDMSVGVSADGQVLLYAGQTFAPGEFYALQKATYLPDAPVWATAIGAGYRVLATPGAPPLDTGSINFRYRASAVPPGEAAFVKLYHWDGAVWTPLPTTLMSSSYYNEATAPLHGPGLYVLMSSLEIPLYGAGWNLFAYPVLGSRPVGEALLSISGVYTTVYGYDVTDTLDPWKIYNVTAPAYVNELTHLRYGQGYWINVSQAITLQLRGGTDMLPVAALHTAPASLLPPATYYGPVLAGPTFTPAVGMTVTAWMEGYLCGQGQTQEVGGDIVYTLDVVAAGPDNGGHCGIKGQEIAFNIVSATGSNVVHTLGIWQNDNAQYLPLAPAEKTTFHVYLPLILR